MNEHIVNVFMYDNMLADRTALDGLVYSTYLYKHAQIEQSTLKYVNDVFNKVWEHYDHMFYIEPEFDIVDDGTRRTDVIFRDEVLEIFENTIDRKKLPVRRVKGTVRNRVNIIMDLLEGR